MTSSKLTGLVNQITGIIEKANELADSYSELIEKVHPEYRK